MVGAAIAGTVGSMAMGASSARSASRANKQAMGYAQETYDYNRSGMDSYVGGAQGMYDLVSGMSFGGGSAQAFESEGGDTGGIEYAQGLMDDWESTFGGIEENMKDYYTNLDPTKFATQSKSEFMSEMDKQMKIFNDTMAASGLQSAGMKQQANKEMAFELAKGNAGIDIASEEYVADKKQGWLNYGSGFKQQATGLLGQAYATDAQLQTQSSIANAGNKTQASIANSNANSAAAAAKSRAMMGAAMYGNDAYLKQANFNDPRIAQANGQAAQHGRDAGGWMGMGGKILGGAIGGGLFGGGSSGGGANIGAFSDTRLKTNMKKLGERNGYNIYSWDWTEQAKELVGDQGTIGVLAQEVMEINPNAVSRHPSGYLQVHYEVL